MSSSSLCFTEPSYFIIIFTSKCLHRKVMILSPSRHCRFATPAWPGGLIFWAPGDWKGERSRSLYGFVISHKAAAALDIKLYEVYTPAGRPGVISVNASSQGEPAGGSSEGHSLLPPPRQRGWRHWRGRVAITTWPDRLSLPPAESLSHLFSPLFTRYCTPTT